MPQSIATVNPKFFLSNSRYTDTKIDWENPNISRFDNGKKVVVMTHGWTEEWNNRHWLNDARDAMKSKNVNFIGIDWAGGAQNLDYVQSAADTQIVGRAVAYMFNKLKNAGWNVNDFECVGHSLGGQACGYAGKYSKSAFNNNIGKVHGLDPAGPMFERTTSEVRIDKGDARFVDVMHTNGGNEDVGFLGMNAAVGHADFFPNGGHDQAGCGTNNFICSHNAAPLIWIDSVSNGGCRFGPCASENDYLNGKCSGRCTSGCNTLGYGSTKPGSNTMYYGDTNSNAPYC